MIRSILKFTLAFILMVVFLNCSGTGPEKDYDYEAHLNKGKNFLDKKKYIRAQEELGQLAVRAMHTEVGDDALFYLGESYFHNKEYILAISEYDRLIRTIGFSEYVERARWRICESYIALSPPYYKDQEYSQRALEKLQEFLDDYPYSEYADEAKNKVHLLRNRLGRKSYESGILYIKLGAFDSAILSFENVLGQYYDTEYADLARFNIIKCMCEMKEFEKAEKRLEQYTSSFEDSSVRESAYEYLDRELEKGDTGK